MRYQVPTQAELKKLLQQQHRLAEQQRQLARKQRQLLRRRLRGLGITQAAAARGAGLPPQRLNDYLRGRRDLPALLLERLLDATL